MQYRLRTLLIVAAMMPTIGPLRLPRAHTEPPHNLKEWPKADQVMPPTAEDIEKMSSDAQAHERVQEWLRRFQLDPSFPLHYGQPKR